MKVHLSGVCGTAMASLAGLLVERGDEVTGSDQDVYPPMSDQLAEMGVGVRTPYAEENVPEDAELVVIGNALSRGNPEVEVVLDRRQTMSSLPATLSERFLVGRRSLVVAGTHGKTTTSSLLAKILHGAGCDPSFLIGGIPLDFGRSYRLGAGPDFVVEGDEYDCAFFDKRPKFVHYRPDVAIVGNVEFDHADIYPDLAAVQRAFSRLLSVIPRRGLLIAGVGCAPLAELAAAAPCRVESFSVEAPAGQRPGTVEPADWQATRVETVGEGSRFRLARHGRDLGSFELPMLGAHNVANAVAALAAAREAGVEPERAREALAGFAGVKRRLEKRGEAAGVVVYDDFAHHPTAVCGTLRALRGAGLPGRVVAVFEPRSYTARTRAFEEGFAEALAEADLVVIAAAYRPETVPPDQRLSEARLAAGVERRGTAASFVPEVGAIVEGLREGLRAGDRVVVLSNGGFGAIHERLLHALRSGPVASRSRL